MRERTIWSSPAVDDPFKWWTGGFGYDDGEPSDAIIESSYLLPLLNLRSTPQHNKNGVVDVCGVIIAANSNSRKGEFVRLGVFNVVLLWFESFEGLILFFSSQPNAVMDQSLYERSLGMDADGFNEVYHLTGLTSRTFVAEFQHAAEKQKISHWTLTHQILHILGY